MPVKEHSLSMRADQLGRRLARMVLPSARELRRAAGLSRSQFKDGIKRVDSGKGQNRTLMPLSALCHRYSPVTRQAWPWAIRLAVRALWSRSPGLVRALLKANKRTWPESCKVQAYQERR